MIDNEYIKLIDQIYFNKELTTYRELEPFRENIKLLFDIYCVDDFYRVNPNFWGQYITEVILLVKELGNIKLSQELVNKMDALNDRYKKSINPILFIYTLEALYKPRIDRNIFIYLDACRVLCSYFYSYYYTFDIDEINTGNIDLDRLYKELKTINNNGTSMKVLYDNEVMISIIFAYINYNKFDSYELLYKYINNIEYYSDKMRLNNCIPGFIHECDYDNAKYIFNNLDSFFTKKRQL